jgi:hypothetical protein
MDRDQPAEPNGMTPMSEADERFSERLADDLARILGTGILIERLELGDADGGPSRIRVVCLFDGRAEILQTEGETSLDAYNRLVRAAAELRLALAWRNMIAPM